MPCSDLSAPIVLASRSPRRIELLGLLVPSDRIHQRPPLSSEEPGFEDCRTVHEVEQRLRSIAVGKRIAVRKELLEGSEFEKSLAESAAILSADTTIVAESASGEMRVLGQPPAEGPARPTVRRWFEEFYFARPHLAVTAVSLERANADAVEVVVFTTVSFSRQRANWLDWYLSTAEPDGKAGGYALQGLASAFVDRVEGSLSNVIGLPLAETRELLISQKLIPG